MKRWILAAMVALALVVGMWGCVQVKVPEGPYVNLGSDAKTTKTTKTEKQVRDFLKKARDDRIISDSQYEKLKDRLEQAYHRR